MNASSRSGFNSIHLDSEAPASDHEEEVKEPVVLTDDQVKAKLLSFEGARRELDESTNKLIGKLLVDDKDENVNADSETYSRLY